MSDIMTSPNFLLLCLCWEHTRSAFKSAWVSPPPPPAPRAGPATAAAAAPLFVVAGDLP